MTGETQMMHYVKVTELVRSGPDQVCVTFEGEDARFRKWVPFADAKKYPIGKEFTIGLVEGGLPF